MQASSNLLVIFEETGGNPFEISINLRAARIICVQVSESHSPPVQKWLNPDFLDGKVAVNDLTPEIHLQCQDGFIMSSIEFASYGTPQGSCQKFSEGNCHASNSLSIVSEVMWLWIIPRYSARRWCDIVTIIRGNMASASQWELTLGLA